MSQRPLTLWFVLALILGPALLVFGYVLEVVGEMGPPRSAALAWTGVAVMVLGGGGILTALMLGLVLIRLRWSRGTAAQTGPPATIRPGRVFQGLAIAMIVSWLAGSLGGLILGGIAGALYVWYYQPTPAPPAGDGPPAEDGSPPAEREPDQT